MRVVCEDRRGREDARMRMRGARMRGCEDARIARIARIVRIARASGVGWRVGVVESCWLGRAAEAPWLAGFLAVATGVVAALCLSGRG